MLPMGPTKKQSMSRYKNLYYIIRYFYSCSSDYTHHRRSYQFIALSNKNSRQNKHLKTKLKLKGLKRPVQVNGRS